MALGVRTQFLGIALTDCHINTESRRLAYVGKQSMITERVD
jgi:hypothetical protein